jgi:hypothetical protein
MGESQLLVAARVATGVGTPGVSRVFDTAFRYEFAARTMNVGVEDLSNLTIQTVRGPVLSGRVVLDGRPGVADSRSIAVSALPRDSHPMSLLPAPNGAVSADGVFRIDGVMGSRVLRLGGVPDGIELQGIYVGGVDITDGFDVGSSDPPEIEIRLTSRPPRLTGTVTAPTGVGERDVVVFAADPAAWSMRHGRRLVRLRSKFDGTFSTAKLPPGDYLAVAVVDLDRSQWANPATLERLRAGATAVTLTEGVATTISLKVKR